MFAGMCKNSNNSPSVLTHHLECPSTFSLLSRKSQHLSVASGPGWGIYLTPNLPVHHVPSPHSLYPRLRAPRTVTRSPLAPGAWPLLPLSEPLCSFFSSRPRFQRHLLRVFCAATGIAANAHSQAPRQTCRSRNSWGGPQVRPPPSCTCLWSLVSPPPMPPGGWRPHPS